MNTRSVYLDIFLYIVMHYRLVIYLLNYVAVGPQGRRYRRTWQIGVFHPTEVAHRVFPPPT
jgi:hypothetical protein